MSLTKKSNEEDNQKMTVDLSKIIKHQTKEKTAATDFAIIPDTMIPAPESFEEFRNLRFVIRNNQHNKEVKTDGTVHSA